MSSACSHHGLRDLQFGQTVQVLLGQVTVLIQQLHHIFGQCQQWTGQVSAVQLVAQKGAQTVQTPVRSSRLQHRVLPVSAERARDSGIQPRSPLPQPDKRIRHVRRVLKLQRGIFLSHAAQITQQLLGIHLQELYRLQQLGRQLHLLSQLRLQGNDAHGRSLLSAAGCGLTCSGHYITSTANGKGGKATRPFPFAVPISSGKPPQTDRADIPSPAKPAGQMLPLSGT